MTGIEGDNIPNLTPPPNLAPAEAPATPANVAATRRGATPRDTLTAAEETELLAEAEILLEHPLLPRGNQRRLARLLDQAYSAKARGSGGPNGPNKGDGANKYCQLSTMAILAPLVSEMTKIMTSMYMKQTALEMKLMECNRQMTKSMSILEEAMGELRGQMKESEAHEQRLAAGKEIAQAVGAGIQIGMAWYGANKAAARKNDPTLSGQSKLNAESEAVQIGRHYSEMGSSVSSIVSGSTGAALDFATAAEKEKQAGISRQEGVHAAAKELIQGAQQAVNKATDKIDQGKEGFSRVLDELLQTAARITQGRGEQAG